ncbi:MAG: hypothetical protein RQ729_09870 [Wenzhouxiangellaceae bacterium]|nr:hypothetical protein [Wenzhouxiangellaceae bacterium]
MHLRDELRAINAQLWSIEDDIRDCKRRQDFGERFVALARSVYRNNDRRTNDRRAAIERRINDQLGSVIVEEKSYADY